MLKTVLSSGGSSGGAGGARAPPTAVISMEPLLSHPTNLRRKKKKRRGERRKKRKQPILLIIPAFATGFKEMCVENATVFCHNNNIAFFSQPSWGSLEMKPKRNKSRSCTLIASPQALLSKGTSLETFQSLMSLLTDSSQVSLGLLLPLFHYRPALEPNYAPTPQEASVGYVQTISIDVG